MENTEEQKYKTLKRMQVNRPFREFREVVCLKLVLEISGIWTKEKERVFQVEVAQYKGMGVGRKHYWGRKESFTRETILFYIGWI